MIDNLLAELQPTARQVWDTLSAIDISEHTETNFAGLTYLSWTWAVTVMKQNYPEFKVEWHPTEWVTTSHNKVNGGEDYQTASVSRTVRIGTLVEEPCWLPVMNPGKGPKGSKHESEINPTTRDISDARQRCLVKAFALCGLGIHIYAGEDIPISEEPKVEETLVREATSLAKDYLESGREFTDPWKQRIRETLDAKVAADLLQLKQELLELLEA